LIIVVMLVITQNDADLMTNPAAFGAFE